MSVLKKMSLRAGIRLTHQRRDWMSAMRLLSPGDSLLGWTLRSTEGSRTALFTVNGSEQRLNVE